MYKLKYDDLLATHITNAYQPYENECEIEILIEIEPSQIKEKFNIPHDYTQIKEIYLLVTLNKKLKTISFISTEYKTFDNEINILNTKYDFEENELIKKIAISKMREEFFKKF